MIVWDEGFDSKTLNCALTLVPAAPSVRNDELIEIIGCGSSLVIVPRPKPSAIVPLVGLLKLRENVSSSSKMLSGTTGTAIVVVTVPGVKLAKFETSS